MRALVAAMLLLSPMIPGSAWALTLALESTAGGTVLVDSAPELGKAAYLIRFDGIKSPWAGKVIRTRLSRSVEREKYALEYEIELSDGKIKREHQLLVEIGTQLIKGSQVKVYRLYLSPDESEAIELHVSPKLAKKSSTVDLLQQHRAAPFTPSVDW